VAGLRITKKVDKFQQHIRNSPRAARELEQKHAEIWASIMRQIMPRDTGAMVESVAVMIGPSGHAGIVIAVFYWKFVNDGTVYISGQFFVEESRELARPGFVKDLKGFVKYLKAMS
jgi:hypothetical protein